MDVPGIHTTIFNGFPVSKPSLADLPVQAQIKRVFGEEYKLAIAVAKAESGLKCDRISKPNTNGTIDRGLFQLNSAYYPHLPNCTDNILKAKEIRDAWGNWEAWSAYNNGAYKKYLKL